MTGWQCQPAYVVSIINWNSRREGSERESPERGVSVNGEEGLRIDYVI